MTMALVLMVTGVGAQTKIDDQRMARDIEVAENVLNTLLRQQMKRNFFPVEVQGSYLPGYGVTFRIPNDMGAMMFMLGEQPRIAYNRSLDGTESLSITAADEELAADEECDNCPDKESPALALIDTYQRVQPPAMAGQTDSVAERITLRMIDAARDFIADYGDMISQLPATEKIIITNRGEGNQRFWMSPDLMPRRKFLSVEGTKGDVVQYKQGKITREQLVSKLHIINSETSEEASPDLELLNTIFNRLYRVDLSKTFFTEEGAYFERLKDFGAIFYMQVFSSHQQDLKHFRMPTLGLDNVDQATRDKKVKAMYPDFIKDLKENMLEYGRTLRSLKEGEQLVFNVRVTKCEGCAIPATVELSLKESVLKEYNQGKLTQEAAISKISVKNGAMQ